jgi:hypothetical protein
MKHIAPRMPQEVAIGQFEKRPWYSFLQPRVPASPLGENLPRIELAWLPYYIVPVEVQSRKGDGVIEVSVEAISGAFAIFQMQPNLEEGPPDGEIYPPKLSVAEAQEIGRKRLLKSVMFKRGQRGKPVPVATGEPELMHYPFWIYYYERRRSLIDFKVLDAATGKRAGHHSKLSFLEAFTRVADEG